MTEHEKMFEMSMEQQFVVARYNRVLDETTDPKILREAAKLMLVSYQKQRAATQWLLKQMLLRGMIDP